MVAKKAQPQKRGVKGYFTGSRLEFLSQYCDEYISLRGKKRAQFWDKLFERWWQTYPWRLADDEEPPTGDPEKMRVLSQVDGDYDLKGSVEKKLRDRITGWFSYRANVRSSRHDSNIWRPILKHVHKQASVKPRCRSVHQQFMLENPTVVDTAFAKLYGDAKDLTRVQKMNHRNEVARDLVNTTYAHLVEELAERAKETHEQELKEWGLGLDDIGEAEDIQSARDSLFSAVHPLLKLIGRYSGCYVTLIASGVSAKEEGRAYFSTVHYFPEDKLRHKNWTEYDEDGFKAGVARPFVKYIHWMEGSEGEEPVVANQPPSPTSMPAPSPSPSTVRPRQPSGTSQQPVPTVNQPQRRKRRMTSPVSSDEEDVDMTIEDNSSSGSSVDPDEFPAKRARSSTIVTRRFKTTTSFQTPTTTTVANKGTTNSSAEASTESANTSDIDETVDPASDTPTRPPSSLSAMDINPVGRSSPDTSVPVITAPLHVQRIDNALSDAGNEPPPDSPDTRLDTETTIPDFLTMKQDIYGYLVEVDEPGFKVLLNNYITFELSNHSGFHGNLSTAHRPKAVGWWLSRARPNKLPPYDSLSSFRDSIVKWWIFLQPDWRREGLECGVTSRDEGCSNASDDEESCWERIYKPGLNGLLNVVILVYWWARILEARGESADEAYRWLVADVTWVLSQLTRIAGEGSGS